MKICDYGCGQEAKHYFPTVGKWCCSKNHAQCPEIKRKNREGNNGRTHSEETRKRISERKKGQEPWNKGKTGVYSEEALKKMSEANKLTIKQIQQRNETFSKEEDLRYNPDKPEEKEIQVHCNNHNCSNSKEKGGWFTPTSGQIDGRRRALEEEQGNDGSFFYCSQECKDTCPCYNLRTDPLQLAEYQHYQKEVWKYTNLSLKYNFNKISNIELRGNKYSYDLDHKFSIIDGFNNNISPKIIGHWKNLEVIKAFDNQTKSRNSSISIEEIHKIGENNGKSEGRNKRR